MPDKEFTFDYDKYKPFKLNKIEMDYMVTNEFIRLLTYIHDSHPLRSLPYATDLLYAQALLTTIATLNTDTLRTPDLAHDLIECSVCHKLIEEPNIEECEFCNEDVCDNCWDKHRCEPYDYAEVL